MKLAVLVSAMGAGGAERVALSLVTEAAEQGHSVDLVLVRSEGELLSDVPPNVAVVNLGAARARAAVPSLMRYLRAKRPDALLAINFEVNLTAALAMRISRSRTALILSVHMPAKNWIEGFRGPARTLMAAASKLGYRRAKVIIAVSEGVARDLTERRWAAPEQLRVIHNPALPENLDELAAEPVNHPFLGDSRTPCIVTVGRLNRLKNQSLLIRAFERVRSKLPANLLIVGQGECRLELERQVSQCGLVGSVDFLGHIANPYPIMRAADLFVLSSDCEGFGNVLVEAMAVGTPVVATDCDYGPREILEGGRWGRLVPPGDVGALASAMLQGLSDNKSSATDRASDFAVRAKCGQYLEVIAASVTRRPG